MEVDAVSTQWFKGKVTKVPRVGEPANESMHYEVTGPWWYLDNLPYRQNFPLDPAANPTVVDPALHRRAVAIIGQGPTGARETNVAAQTDILDWCIAAGADFVRGTLPTGYHVPYMGITAPYCSEALRASLKWMPDAASRFDYTAETPVFSVVRRGDADDVTIDLPSEPGISIPFITPRPDLQVDHVVIQGVSVNGSNAVVVVEDVDPPGSTGREFGSIVIPIPAAAGDVLFTGLAANWRSGLSELQYQGRIVFEEAECLRTIRPGDVINITGGLGEWETMRAQVASVTEFIDEGRTEYEIGPPEHLSVQDLIETVVAARWQNTGLLKDQTLAGFRKEDDDGLEDPGVSEGVFDSGAFSGDVSVAGNLHVLGNTQVDGTTTLGDLIAASATIGGWDIDGTLFAHGGRLDAAETAITALDGRLDAVEFDLPALESRVTNAESDIVSLGEIDDAIIADIGTLVTTVNEHSTAITTLDGRLDTVEFDLPALESRVTNAESDIVSLGEIDDAIIADVETVFDLANAHSTAITALDGRLTTAEGAVSAYETRIAALEAFMEGITELSLEYCGGSATFLTV